MVFRTTTQVPVAALQALIAPVVWCYLSGFGDLAHLLAITRHLVIGTHRWVLQETPREVFTESSHI